MVCLAAIALWWVAQGGASGRLIDIDRAPPQSYVFEVDVNQADWPELALLPEIGVTLAQAIVRHRETHGPFQSVDDLQQVDGIGPATLRRMRPHLAAIPSDHAGEAPAVPAR